jgi:hypothetical protein
MITKPREANPPQGSSRREFLGAPVRGLAAAAFVGGAGAFGATGGAVRMEQEGNDVKFTAGRTTVCRLTAIGTADGQPPAGAAAFDRAKADIIDRRLSVGDWEISDTIRIIGPDLFEWRRAWKNTSDKPAQGDFRLDVESGYKADSTLIPAVSYDGNRSHYRGGTTGLTSNGVPWIFSAHRGSVPGASYSDGGGWSIFLFTSAERPSVDCGVSLAPTDQNIAHRLFWPERENTRRRRQDAGGERRLEIGSGQSFEVRGYLVLRPAPEPRKTWRGGLDHAWRLNRHDMKAWYPPKRLWDLSIQFARESLWYEGQDFVGFNIGLQPTDGGWQQRPSNKYEIGWCGQNAAFGAAMLQDYIWNKNVDSRRKAEKALDFWAENGRLKCGLFYTNFDVKLGAERGWGPYNKTFLNREAKPGEYFIDPCNLGYGAYQFLLASELAEKALGKPKPQWRKLALDACDFFVEHALPDGTFGKAWSLEGECLAPDSTVGAFFVWPLVKAYRMTKNAKYLNAAHRAFRTYVDRDLNRLTCWGGALDADCLDRESVQPLMIAGLDLYEATGKKEYLRDAEMAAYYLASYQWHYSIPFHPDSPGVRDLKYDVFSSTSVGVGGPGQDPYGEFIALGWLRLGKITGNPIWRDRGIQTFKQGMIGVSDGDLVLKGKRRPAGSQNEGFGYSRRPGQDEFQADYNEWLVAWPAAFRLMTMMHWLNWRDFEV